MEAVDEHFRVVLADIEQPGGNEVIGKNLAERLVRERAPSIGASFLLDHIISQQCDAAAQFKSLPKRAE